MELRFTTRGKLQVRKADNGESRVIEGYAAVFYDGTPETEFELWPGVVERIMRGAFDDALKRGDDARGLFNHDPNQILGRRGAGTLKLSVDDVGLRYEITAPDSPTGKSVVAAIDREDVAGSSFSFTIPHGGQRWIEEAADGERPERDVREILSVELFDVGPVVFPAYAGTSTGVRDSGTKGLRDGGREEAREAFDAWRASRRRAKTRDRDIEVEARMAELAKR